MTSLSARQGVGVTDPADVIGSALDDVQAARHGATRGQSPRWFRARLAPRRFAFVAAGALAGLLAGINLVGVSVLEVLLRGIEEDSLQVPGLLRAGWRVQSGFDFTFAPGMPILLAAMTLVGAAVAWAVVSRRPR